MTALCLTILCSCVQQDAVTPIGQREVTAREEILWQTQSEVRRRTTWNRGVAPVLEELRTDEGSEAVARQFNVLQDSDKYLYYWTYLREHGLVWHDAIPHGREAGTAAELFDFQNDGLFDLLIAYSLSGDPEYCIIETPRSLRLLAGNLYDIASLRGRDGLLQYLKENPGERPQCQFKPVYQANAAGSGTDELNDTDRSAPPKPPVSGDELIVEGAASPELQPERTVVREDSSIEKVTVIWRRDDRVVMKETTVLESGFRKSRHWELFGFNQEQAVDWRIDEGGLTSVALLTRRRYRPTFYDFAGNGTINLLEIHTHGSPVECFLIRNTWTIEPLPHDLWKKTQALGMDWLMNEGLQTGL